MRKIYLLMLIVILLSLITAKIDVGINDMVGDSTEVSVTLNRGNSSWNKTYADTLYYPKYNNALSFWNDTYATFNKTYADTLYINKSSESNLNVNSSTWWASLTGWVNGWFYSSGNELSFNETKLNDTIDERTTKGLWTNISGVATYEGDINVTGNIYHSQNITNPLNSSWGIYNNGTCIVIGDLQYVSEC